MRYTPALLFLILTVLLAATFSVSSAEPKMAGDKFSADTQKTMPDKNSPFLSEIQVFTLPDGNTQLSWTTKVPTGAAVVQIDSKEGKNQKIIETEDGQRNHRVVLTGLSQGELCSALVAVPVGKTGKNIFGHVDFCAGQRAIPNLSKPVRIRLTVDEPTKTGRQNWPVFSGIPFSKGELARPNDLRLVDENAAEIPAQFQTFCSWPDGSVKWLICNFRANTRPEKPVVYFLETGSKSDPAAANRSGSSKMSAASTPTNSSDEKPELDEKQQKRIKAVLKSISSNVFLADGTLLEYRAGEFKTECAGPLCAAVCGSGVYKTKADRREFTGRCELNLFGDDFVRVRWFVGNNILDNVMTLVNSVDLTFQTRTTESFIFSDGRTAKKRAVIFQETEKKAEADLDGKKSTLNHFSGFVAADGKSWFFRDFRQTWPKGLVCQKDKIIFNILPKLPRDYRPDRFDSLDETLLHYYWLKNNAYQFKRGMEIGHDLWITTRTAHDPEIMADHLAHPLFAVCEPAYYCQTGTFAPCNPVRKGEFDRYEEAFQKSFENFEKGRQKRGEYGWMNFGDWFGESMYHWGNNEYDGAYVCFLHFIRSGNLDYFWRGLEMARHYSTVDFKAHPWDPKARERMCLHCFGHVNGFFDKNDPRIQLIKNATQYAVFDWETDDSGGHDFQPGLFFGACLTGDRRMFETAEAACFCQAQRYTSNFNFSIERAAGWPLINAVNAYQFTGNPFYLNAADLYFEVIKSKQDKETGCFNLPQDLLECDCPDKKLHRGGKAFAVGILLHGLIRYYEMTKLSEVRDVIVHCADWLLDYSWNEEKQGFRYKTGCPKYADSGKYSLLPER